MKLNGRVAGGGMIRPRYNDPGYDEIESKRHFLRCRMPNDKALDDEEYLKSLSGPVITYKLGSASHA